MRRAGPIAAGMCALALLVPGASPAAVGDLYVADLDSGAGLDGAVLKIGPGGGAPSVFAADAALFDNPYKLVMDRNRTLLVADYSSDKILRISRSGAIAEFFDVASQAGPTDLDWGADGFLYVLDYEVPNIIRINRRTKAFTEVADSAGVPDWDSGYGLVVARDGTIYFTDGGDEVFKVSPGGSVTDLYEGPLLLTASDIVISPDEKFLYVSDESNLSVVRVNRATGAASNLATGFTGVGGLLNRSDGSFLVGNPTADRLDRVPAGGSPITTFSSGADYDAPFGMLVEPAACGGRLPTVVGTTGKDVIRGSRFADVIATLAGKDVVRGLAGKDIVCGGGGPDLLIGGGARDTLIGGKGKDRLVGGKGRDKLRGGPGRDRQRQ